MESSSSRVLKLILVAALLYCVQLSVADDLDDNGIRKLDVVVSKAADRIFNVETANEWKKWVTSKRKQYNAVILLTVGDSLKDQCKFCPQFRKMFGLLSAVYHSQKTGNTPKVQFGVLEYSQQTVPIVQTLGVNQVPMVMLFHEKSDKPAFANLQQMGIPEFLQQELGIDINWNDLSGVDNSLIPRQEGAAAQEQEVSPALEQAIKLFFAGVVILTFVMIGLTIYSYAGSKITALMVLSCIIYMTCMGGLVYNILNQPPLYYSNPYKPGSTVIFMPQHMAQFALEGYIATFTMVASALALIGLVAYVPTVESSTWQRIYAIVFMLVFFGGVLCLVIYYLHKSEWYLSGTAATPYLTIIRELFVRK